MHYSLLRFLFEYRMAMYYYHYYTPFFSPPVRDGTALTILVGHHKHLLCFFMTKPYTLHFGSRCPWNKYTETNNGSKTNPPQSIGGERFCILFFFIFSFSLFLFYKFSFLFSLFFLFLY